MAVMLPAVCRKKQTTLSPVKKLEPSSKKPALSGRPLSAKLTSRISFTLNRDGPLPAAKQPLESDDNLSRRTHLRRHATCSAFSSGVTHSGVRISLYKVF